MSSTGKSKTKGDVEKHIFIINTQNLQINYEETLNGKWQISRKLDEREKNYVDKSKKIG